MTDLAASFVSEKPEDIKHIGSIPIHNLWLLMLYASDLFRHLDRHEKVSVEKNPDDIPDLVAEILAREVALRLKRNLRLEYQARTAVLRRVRGRINLLHTERHRFLDRGMIACSFNEMTVNTPRNRFVRAALDQIARNARRKDLVRRCRSLASSLKRAGVTGEKPRRGEVSVNRFGRHDAEDQKMVHAAHLAFNLGLPTESAGTKLLVLPEREVSWIRKLYEKGVAGFYKEVLSEKGWDVYPGRRLYWSREGETSGISEILPPSMQTDIVLDNRNEKRRVVVDTKFTSIVTQGWHRDETLRSAYMYQIYAYLKSQKGRGDHLADKAEGLLLHPSVGDMVNETVIIQGHQIRFATVDLSANTKEIRRQLCDVVLKPADFGRAAMSLS